jgi:hypothetical protein
MGRMSELFTVEQRVSEITERFWDADEAEQAVLRAEYREVLQPALLAAYGPNESCFIVDPWTAETFSDLYKDRNGFRPRSFNYRAMMDWMANIPPLEDEDRFDPDITKWDDADEDEEDVMERAADFEQVYGVSAMGQALRFNGMLDGY